MDLDEPVEQPPTTPLSPASAKEGDQEPLKFTSVIRSLRSVYSEQAMADISTSYCFICLLHLANEKGLEIVNDAGRLTELNIREDVTATTTGDDF
jgi:condensin complex subunit 2